MGNVLEHVVLNWNVSDDGELLKNKNKYYSSEVFKEFPKTSEFFADIKPKLTKVVPSKTETSFNELSKVEINSNNIGKTEDVLNSSDNVEKVKKKKKKHKVKDSSL